MITITVILAMKEADGRVAGSGSGGASISDARATPGGPGPPPGAPSILLLWVAPGWDRGGPGRCFPLLCPGRARGWLAEGFESRRAWVSANPERPVQLRSPCKCQKHRLACAPWALGEWDRGGFHNDRLQLWRGGAARPAHLELGPER